LAKTPFSGCSPHSIPTSFDGVHPNEKGYAIMGPLVLAVIDKTLGK
jgi:lysophospholipase L1-like esterase